jgi:hypothetical protein
LEAADAPVLQLKPSAVFGFKVPKARRKSESGKILRLRDLFPRLATPYAAAWGTQSIPASFHLQQTQIGIFSMSSTGQTYRGQPFVGGKAAAEFLRDMTAGMSHEERLAQVRWLARLMDDNFRVPGTRLRFGWDSVLGFFPGLGDVLTSAISLIIVHHAWQTGASKLTLTRMLANVGVDFVVGAIPFLGDLFDFAFKANRRNARLLEQHFGRQAKRGIRSRSAW